MWPLAFEFGRLDAGSWWQHVYITGSVNDLWMDDDFTWHDEIREVPSEWVYSADCPASGPYSNAEIVLISDAE